MRLLILAATALALSTAPALAQTAPDRVRLKGTIASFAGGRLAVTQPGGATLQVAVPDGALVVGDEMRRFADIKPGDFVGSAARPGGDGKLHALEVHIFPEALRGTGEGQRPWSNGGAGDSMTNATVSEVVRAVEGRVLKMTYHGGEAAIVVDPPTPVFEIVPLDRRELKPGAAVSVLAGKGADGTYTARAVTVEHLGVKPVL